MKWAHSFLSPLLKEWAVLYAATIITIVEFLIKAPQIGTDVDYVMPLTQMSTHVIKQTINVTNLVMLISS